MSYLWDFINLIKIYLFAYFKILLIAINLLNYFVSSVYSGKI